MAPGAVMRVYVLAGRPDNRLPASSLALGTYAEAILTFGDRTVGSSLAGMGLARLGDLNRDGYDDFGVSLDGEREGPQEASVYIYYGSRGSPRRRPPLGPRPRPARPPLSRRP